MLVVLVNSQGICALICVGETYVSGAATPLNYTCTPPRVVGKLGCVRSADTVCPERFVPLMLTIVPGPTEAALPPPLSEEPAAVAVIFALLETVAEYVGLSPRGPGTLA